MSDRSAEIRFLAERVHGWTISEFNARTVAVRGSGDTVWLYNTEGWPKVDPIFPVWNPFTIESDCARLLRALPEEKRDQVIGHMECICVPELYDEFDPSHVWSLVTATPDQRTRAVLMAYGYKEEENDLPTNQ